MSERGNLAGIMSEILNKSESIPGLSKDERDSAFRTYKLLYELDGYRLTPIYLAAVFALTISFAASALFLGLRGPQDPNLILAVVGSFLASFIPIVIFLRMNYNPYMKAAISGFKFVMKKDDKIKLVVEQIKIKDPKTAKPINKYLLS